MSRSWKNEFHRWRDKCKNIEECTLDIEECRGDSKFSFHPLVDTLNICKSWHDLTEGGKRKTYYANGYIIFFLNDYSTCKHIITVTYIPSLLFNLSYKILSKCKELTFILLLSINPHPTHPTPPFLFSRPRTHYLTSLSLNCLSLSLFTPYSSYQNQPTHSPRQVYPSQVYKHSYLDSMYASVHRRGNFHRGNKFQVVGGDYAWRENRLAWRGRSMDRDGRIRIVRLYPPI